MLVAQIEARAFCSEPDFYTSVPDAPSTIGRPDAPYCLSGYQYNRKHTCEDYEIDSYINETNDYIRELKEFVSESVQFADEARRFASEAGDYAECEAREAKSEIE